jgi:hypothetical protein
MGQEVDVTLYGESLRAWGQWVAGLEREERLLRWATRANRAAVMISLPLWMIAAVLSIPLTLPAILTGGLLFWPLHWLVIRPLTFLVVWTSDLWTAIPVLRPALLFIGPPLAALGLIALHLIPDGNVDIKHARQVLCELWPLSYRRLRWIAEYGTGRAQRTAG